MMKKIVTTVLVLTLFVTLTGCVFNFDGSTEAFTFYTMPDSTNAPVTTFDQGDIIDGVYQKIYDDLYDEIRAEVVADISEEAFQAILDDVLADLYAKEEAGDITIETRTIVEEIHAVIESSLTAVVGISNYDVDGERQGIGSGVIYKQTDNTFFVVTNNHVIENAEDIAIRFSDETEVDATLLGIDETADIAVLSFESLRELTVASFGDSDATQKGTVVLAVGNPSGYEFFGSVTMGIISGKNRYFDTNNDGVRDMFVSYLQHDAAINSGNSGGALLNLDGEIIGINVIKIASMNVEGMGFAVPANLVAAICSDIEQYGESRQVVSLGIQMIQITESNVDALIDDPDYDIPTGVTSGFYIIEVVPDSSVDGYIQTDDIVIQVGDIEIGKTTDFSNQFQKYKVGDVIDITVIRDGETLVLEDIELKAKPSETE